jgi:hypothetical protein
MSQHDEVRAQPFDPTGPCIGCGSRVAQTYDGPDGRVRLCPACAVSADLGCP